MKTVHKGNESADMQLITEMYSLMCNGYDQSPSYIRAVFDLWKKSALDSYMVKITGQGFARIDVETGSAAVDVMLDAAG